MTKVHNYSFFGQSVGMIVNSNAEELSWFIRMIKAKPDGSWEKPSQKEGKVVSISMDETVMILQVLSGLQEKCSFFHDYKGTKTSIAFTNGDVFWINIGNYSKSMNFAQQKILKDLVRHFYEEKIEQATVPQKQSSESSNPTNTESKPTPKPIVQPQPQPQPVIQQQAPEFQQAPTLDNISIFTASVKQETDKALLLEANGKEVWFPKSTIHCEYHTNPSPQEFLIDDWILKKNNLIL